MILRLISGRADKRHPIPITTCAYGGDRRGTRLDMSQRKPAKESRSMALQPRNEHRVARTGRCASILARDGSYSALINPEVPSKNGNRVSSLERPCLLAHENADGHKQFRRKSEGSLGHSPRSRSGSMGTQARVNGSLINHSLYCIYTVHPSAC